MTMTYATRIMAGALLLGSTLTMCQAFSVPDIHASLPHSELHQNYRSSRQGRSSLASSLSLRQDDTENESTHQDTRRSFLRVLMPATAAMLATTPPHVASALDMDAFAKQELVRDSAPAQRKLTEDEALCRFGQPSKGKGEACVRAGMPTKGLGKNGLDAFGKVDRGEFARCTKSWEIGADGRTWESTAVCK